MPLNKKQIERFIKFTGLLKLGKYPNAKKFWKILQDADLYANEDVACSVKTIQRDIQTLKNKYGAPIQFDHARNGYYLTHTGWELTCPILQDEVMLASVLGSKLAQDIMPEPVKSTISDAVDQELTTNSPDFLDTAYIDSLIAASGVKVKIEPLIFATVFDAWQQHEALDIKYKANSGKISDRRIEPHVLTYYNAAWYIKGFCLEKNEVRVFAIHRIIKAEHTEKFFEPDQLIIQDVKNRHVFNYKTVKNIEIKCSKAIAGYINEQHEFYDEEITEHNDGSVTVRIPEAPEHEIVKWVLSEGGNAKIIKPKSIQKKIIKAAENVLAVNT